MRRNCVVECRRWSRDKLPDTHRGISRSWQYGLGVWKGHSTNLPKIVTFLSRPTVPEEQLTSSLWPSKATESLYSVDPDMQINLSCPLMLSRDVIRIWRWWFMSQRPIIQTCGLMAGDCQKSTTLRIGYHIRCMRCSLQGVGTVGHFKYIRISTR